jgi:hypothetical protein
VAKEQARLVAHIKDLPKAIQEALKGLDKR